MGSISINSIQLFSIYDAMGRKRTLAFINASMSSSYATNGDTLSLSSYLSSIQAVVCQSHAGGYALEASASGTTVTVVARYYDYDAAADGTAIEVSGGTDLSSVSFTLVVLGD